MADLHEITKNDVFINITTRKDQTHITTIGYNNRCGFENKYKEFIDYIRSYPNRSQEFKVLFSDISTCESYIVYRSLKEDLSDLYQIVQYSVEDFSLRTKYEPFLHCNYCKKLILCDQYEKSISYYDLHDLIKIIDSCQDQKLFIKTYFYQLCLSWGICDELNQVLKNYTATPIIDAYENVSDIGVVLNRKSNSMLLLKDL